MSLDACVPRQRTIYNPSKFQSGELRQQGKTLSVAHHSLSDSKHLLHQLMVRPIIAHEEKTTTLTPICACSTQAAQSIKYKWIVKYSEDQSKLRLFVPRLCSWPLGMGLPRPARVRLNRLCTGVARFQSSLYKWGLARTSICECSALDQTTFHLILKCPLHRALRGYHGLPVLDDDTRCWLNNTAANI